MRRETGKNPSTRLSIGVVVIVALTALPACGVRFNNHRRAIAAMQADGDYEEILVSLDEPGIERLYGPKNELLLYLDRGSAAMAAGDPDRAFYEWEAADRLMESRREKTLAEGAGVLIVNDMAAPYLGEPYEDMYVNVFKMLAHLETGWVQGGATVEARRMALKANLLRDEYLRYSEATQKESDAPEEDVDQALSRVTRFDSDGQFVESPLGAYLTAVTFMQSGAPELQRVAARRLLQIIEAQGDLVGNIDPDDFSDLAERRPEDANVLAVAFAGRGPTKESVSLPPLVIARAPVYAELPVVRTFPSDVAAVRMVHLSGDGAPPGAFWDLDFVENLGNVAAVNFRAKLPLIYTRTLLRAGAKSVAFAIASENVSDSRGSASGAGVALAGLLAMLATERADLRCWETLPGEAHVRLAHLPPGEHVVRLEWLDDAGRIISLGDEQTIIVPEQGLATLIGYHPR